MANPGDHEGKKQRILNLWNLLLVADPRGMIDIRMTQVAGVVGCTERYAKEVWMALVRGGIGLSD